MKRFGLIVMLAMITIMAVPAAAFAEKDNTQVPGHQKSRYDKDGNGTPDAGVMVNGHYTSVYAYDANGDFYWDLGDGRVQSSPGVDGIEDLDAETTTFFDYVVNYRGTFENDPFLDSGWIKQTIRQSGFDGRDTYMYFVVHETDHRYTGDPEWAIWDNWEYFALVHAGEGNLVMPARHMGE